MRRIITIAVVLLYASHILKAEEAKLQVTADVGICAHPAEKTNNTGSKPRVRVKGIEHFYLFKFETDAIDSWTITKATLHVKLAQGHLRKMAFSTVPIDWVEGTGDDKPQKGSPCFTQAKFGQQDWTLHGGTMMDATFNSPYMLWRTGDVTADNRTDGKWLKIDVDPALVQAAARGLSYGLVMSDEKGQTRENHDIYTREQNAAKPFLVVEGQREVKTTKEMPAPAFKCEADADAAGIATGAIRVNTRTEETPYKAADILASKVLVYRSPGPPREKEPIQTHITFADPAVTIRDLEPGAEYCIVVQTHLRNSDVAEARDVKVTASAELPHVKSDEAVRAAKGVILPDLSAIAGCTADFSPKDDKPRFAPACVLTPRNAWAGFSFAVAGEGKDFSVEVRPLEYTGKQKGIVLPLSRVYLYRAWYVPAGKGTHAEALVPLKNGEAFEIPWAANRIAGQKSQQVFVDIFIPAGIVPGPYKGQIIIKQAGKQVQAIDLALQVSPVTLSDRFKIAGDCNTYDSPAGALGIKPAQVDKYFAAERKYYQLAHQHRMTLNVLPYSQAGKVHTRSAPDVDETPKGLMLSGWKDWDERYGPLLNGSAFGADAGYVGPGAGVPLRHMYTAFHENWPCAMADHFKPWPPPKDYAKLLAWTAELPAIEKCFDTAYRDNWVSAQADFRKHAEAKGYTKTDFQVYLNDKIDFRDPERGGRGISLWLLDEPMFSDDFLALRYFSLLASQAAKNAEGNKSRVQYRIDISRPTHQRDILDGMVGLNVLAEHFYDQRWWIDYRKRKYGEEYWNYAMPKSFLGDNALWAIWPIQSLCWGATGTLPWQTIGHDGDLDKASATVLMYPGQRFGIDGPLASLRMKAWRQGLQDVELLRMLAEKSKWNDIQIRAFVGQVLGLDGWKDSLDPKEDAGIVTFSGVTAEKLDFLRRVMIAAME